MIVLAIILVAIAYWLWHQDRHRGKALPPGPSPWPVVGNMIQMATDDSKYVYETFEKLAAIYGPLFMFRNGSVKTVVANGYEACKKILTNDEWLERTDDRMMLLRVYEKKQGLFYGHLNLWKSSRRFTVRNLRDYGFGKKETMEMFVGRETLDIQKTLDRLVTEGDGHFVPHHFFDIPALNIVWAMITGTRFDHGDPEVRKLVDGMIKVNHALKFTGGILSAFPILHKVLPDSLLGLNHLHEEMGQFRKSMEQLIEQYRLNGTYKSDPQNFVEIFLQHNELVKKGELDDPERTFTEQNLVSILYDIFWAGSDTSSSTISYAILWLTIHPHVQQKLRNELKEFVQAKNREPTVHDKNELPYTRAVILEVHRRSSIVPYTPRKVYKDTPYDDFIMPKDTVVLVNYHSVLMDKGHWGDPENFRPERFLDSSNHITNAEHVIPFALGKRNCMGETVAETSIFLLMTFLFSRYEFQPIAEGHKYDLDPIPGVVEAPKPFEVKMKLADRV